MSVTIAIYGQVLLTAPPTEKDIKFMAHLKATTKEFQDGNHSP